MPGNSEVQRANASRMTSKRVDMVAELVTPEIQDARALLDELDEEVANALMDAKADLPKGEQFDAARTNTLLSMHARHNLIVKLAASGMRTDRIARAIGVSTATVKHVIGSYFNRVEKELRSQRLDEFVLLMAEGYLEDIDRLSDFVARGGNNPSNVIGAIKARQEARRQYVELLVDFGFIDRKTPPPTQVGDNATIDNRTQNVIVVSEDKLKEITKGLLAEKRQRKSANPGEDTIVETEAEDDRITSLVVADEPIPS